MISKQDEFNLSPYSALYELVVPHDNLLRQINELVDFSFVLKELESKYCLDNGRMAIHPIRMFKYLLLKSIYKLSDVDVVERSRFDMSFKYFLDMAPEEDVIHPSSLTKFRRQRLVDSELLDLLIGKTIEIAIEIVFNKDANTYACRAGHLATHIKREIKGQKNKNPRVRYMFDVEKCKICPFKAGCYKEGAKTKSFYVAGKSDEHAEQMAFQKTERFKEMTKERYKIEAKNSELKQRHGLEKAISSGLFGMQIQGATTIFAVNMKRIIKLINEKKG